MTTPVATDGQGNPIYLRPLPQGFFVVVEARPGPSGRPVGTVTFNSDLSNPNALPDFQIFPSRALGNGSTRVCDDQSQPPIGGVPAVNPPSFGGSQAVSNAINDFACRFTARTLSENACTKNEFQVETFVVSSSRVQFCPAVGIGAELAFPSGDTRVTVRVRDNLGQPGLPASIIIRVSQ